jgi:hypothetical protein
MVSPDDVRPPAQQDPRETELGLPGGGTNKGHFLHTFGFHVLVLLLGIALAFFM